MSIRWKHFGPRDPSRDEPLREGFGSDGLMDFAGGNPDVERMSTSNLHNIIKANRQSRMDKRAASRTRINATQQLMQVDADNQENQFRLVEEARARKKAKVPVLPHIQKQFSVPGKNPKNFWDGKDAARFNEVGEVEPEEPSAHLVADGKFVVIGKTYAMIGGYTNVLSAEDEVEVTGGTAESPHYIIATIQRVASAFTFTFSEETSQQDYYAVDFATDTETYKVQMTPCYLDTTGTDAKAVVMEGRHSGLILLGASDTYKVKSTTGDASPGYLNDELTVSDGLTKTTPGTPDVKTNVAIDYRASNILSPVAGGNAGTDSTTARGDHRHPFGELKDGYPGGSTGDMLYWSGSDWVLLSAPTAPAVLCFQNNAPTWVTVDAQYKTVYRDAYGLMVSDYARGHS